MKPDCECIQAVEARNREYFSKSSLVYFDDEDLLSGRLSNKVTCEFVKLGGSKKYKKSIVIFHNYCPFCGKKYKE